MKRRTAGKRELWSIILAGGDGKRVSPLVTRWMGRHKPKQYCTFVGTRSMFQHTLDRAAQMGPLEHTVVVVDRTHALEARAQLEGRPGARLLLQPSNRDTAAGVLLPLTYVRAFSPDATVAICPSDHFVYPEDRFVEALQRAAEMVETLPERPILLGVVPDAPETDYGWIRPADGIDGGWAKTVDSFIEKPAPGTARAALAQGALWNTLILIAKVGTIWGLAKQHIPDISALFESFDGTIGSTTENFSLESIYSVMPSRNFSSALLQPAARQLAVASLDGVCWSDWGRPERIVATLRKIGRIPAFPLECLPAAANSVSRDLYASTA